MPRTAAAASVPLLGIAGTCAPVYAQDLEEQRPIGEIALSDDALQVRCIASGSEVDLDRLQLLFGPRAYAALLEDENSDVLAVSIGVEVRCEFDRASGFALAGQAFYAPDILTFGGAKTSQTSARGPRSSSSPG